MISTFNPYKREVIEIENFKILEENVLTRVTFHVPFRAHDVLKNEARFMFIVNGKSTLFTPAGSKSFETGDCLLMKCDNFVNNWHSNPDDAPSQIVVLRISPKVLEHIYKNDLPAVFSPLQQQEGELNAVSKIPADKSLEGFVNGLSFYFDEPRLITEELMSLKVKELIFLLSSLKESIEIKPMLQGLFQPKEYKLRQVVQANLYENLNLEELAFFCGLSLSSFQREFRSVFGKSPAKYIKQARIEKARLLLEKPDVRVSEVGFMVGFESASHFSKAFHAAFNLSPSNYQKSKLQQE